MGSTYTGCDELGKWLGELWDGCSLSSSAPTRSCSEVWREACEFQCVVYGAFASHGALFVWKKKSLFSKKKPIFSKKKKVTAPSGAGFSRMELQSSEHLVICRAVFKVPKWLQMLLFLCQPCHTISWCVFSFGTGWGTGLAAGLRNCVSTTLLGIL